MSEKKEIINLLCFLWDVTGPNKILTPLFSDCKFCPYVEKVYIVLEELIQWLIFGEVFKRFYLNNIKQFFFLWLVFNYMDNTCMTPKSSHLITLT